MKKNNIRIKDIAVLARVSMGTVDRVLHQRGRVSAAAEARVKKVLKDIDYQPNVVAKTLSKSQTHTIAVLMPHPNADPFWKTPQYGILEAEQNLRTFGVETVNFLFNPYQSQSFQEQADQVLDTAPDGILLAPVLRQEALAFAQRCQDRSIPLVAFNTYIETMPARAFIGQDLYQSGRVAAELIAMGRPSGRLLIVHIAEQAQNSAHLYAKEQGFRAYFSEREGGQQPVTTIEIDDPAVHTDSFEARLHKQLLSYSDVEGIFVTTAKAHALVPYLAGEGMTHCRVIGYDLTEPNLTCLRQGTIQVLIHQEIQKQAFLGVTYLADQLIFKRDIPAVKHLPLGIVTRENLDSYLSSE